MVRSELDEAVRFFCCQVGGGAAAVSPPSKSSMMDDHPMMPDRCQVCWNG
jgi:hypothetical protein